MSRPVPAAAAGSSAQAVEGRSVRWGQPPLRFALESSDPEVLAQAGVVLRPWMNASAGTPHRRWSIERSVDGAWRAQDSRDPSPIDHPTVEAAVRAIEGLAVDALLDAPEATTLHAALVARGERGIMIVGSSRTGKSTLAVALWQRGFTLLGDDVTVVDPIEARAWPAPRRVGLRFPSRDLLGDVIWSRIRRSSGCEVTGGGCLFHPDEVEAGPRPSSIRLAAMVFLGRRDVFPEPARARPLAAAHALLAVLPYTSAIAREDTGTIIRRFQPLMTRVPTYDLGRGAIDAMTATIDGLLGESAG